MRCSVLSIYITSSSPQPPISRTTRIPNRLFQIKPVQVQRSSSTTELARVPRTLEVTLAIRQVRAGCRACIASCVQTVSAPALLAVFDSSVLVVPALGETLGDGHCGGVVFELAGEETARGRLGHAGVVGKVYVALGGNGWAGVGRGFAGCGRRG